METTAATFSLKEIGIDRTNQIVEVWTSTIDDLLRALRVKTSNIFARNRQQRRLIELQKKLNPLLVSHKSQFFLFNNGEADQSCIVKYNVKKSTMDGSLEELKIIKIYDNPHTIFQTSKVRRNITVNCIEQIKTFTQIYRFPRITISVNSHTDEVFFSRMGFKNYDKKNPHIMHFYTSGFFDPSVMRKRKHEWILIR
jgi:hypothetical protein